MKVENYIESFKELKEKSKEDSFEEREFYSLIEEIEAENKYLFEQAEKHPKYNFEPTKEVPESIALDTLEKLIIDIQKFIKKSQPFDPEEELDRMFPDRHDEDFDEDSMSYDSIFGGD